MASDNYCGISVVRAVAPDGDLQPDGACAQPTTPTGRSEVGELGGRVGSCLINIWGCESNCVILQDDSRLQDGVLMPMSRLLWAPQILLTSRSKHRCSVFSPYGPCCSAGSFRQEMTWNSETLNPLHQKPT